MPRLSLPSVFLLTAPLILSCNQPATEPDLSVQQGGINMATAAPATAGSNVVRSPRFDPDNFVRVVDNRFFPLRPGTRFIYKGEEDGEGETNVTLVTHDRKNILGISAVVVLDRVFVQGELKEKTFDWYAQDKDGNVWYLGEDTREYEDGKVVSTAGSFEAGKNGAKAGIIMLAHPQVGDMYHQEFARGSAEDQARVVARGLSVSVPYGSFDGCLKTVEFTRLEPGVKEAKLYCPGIGFVKARGLEGPKTRLVLFNIFR
jgi:hypothetical protein